MNLLLSVIDVCKKEDSPAKAYCPSLDCKKILYKYTPIYKKNTEFFYFYIPACFILMVKMVMLIHGFTCQLNAEFLEYLDIHI